VEEDEATHQIAHIRQEFVDFHLVFARATSEADVFFCWFSFMFGSVFVLFCLFFFLQVICMRCDYYDYY
jgi:hypothetical protein